MTTLGIDVSRWQGENVPYEELRKLGISFCKAKCSHGTWGKDPTFDRNWKAAQDAGLSIGPYHWFVPGEDPKAQARAFADRTPPFAMVFTTPQHTKVSREGPGHYTAEFSTVGPIPRYLAPVIDFEQPTQLEPKRLLSDFAECVHEYEAILRICQVEIYTAKWYWSQFVKDAEVNGFVPEGRSLWCAHYPSLRREHRTDYERSATLAKQLPSMPALPDPWQRLGATCWQFDGDGGLYLPNGVDVDVNLMLVSWSDYMALVDKEEPYAFDPSKKDGPYDVG